MIEYQQIPIILLILYFYYFISHYFNNAIIETNRPVAYENLYLEHFNNELSNNSTDCSLNYEKLKDIFIKEDTPAGVIYLNYNIDYESFDYYTNKTIPYKYLDTVARKYMIDNNCKELNVDIYNEILKKKEQHNQAEKLKKEEQLKREEKLKKEKEEGLLDSSDDDCVFVKFKSYNVKKENVKQDLIKQNTNKFRKIGSIYDYLNRDNNENKTQNKQLSFSDYKKNKQI